jgi:hypothetical protein
MYSFTSTRGQNYPTYEVYSSVFQILNIETKKTATAFSITHDYLNYFVTARHLFEKAKNKDKITFAIFSDSTWKSLQGIIYLDSNSLVDIAVIRPINVPYFESGFDLKITTFIMGEDSFFAGFPFGLKMLDTQNLNNNFPLALVKKGIISGSTTENGVHIIFLDGHNNPGFSGSPIIVKSNMDNKWHLIGVISAYRKQFNDLEDKKGNKYLDNNKRVMEYHENSGIVIGIGLKHIIDILNKNK